MGTDPVNKCGPVSASVSETSADPRLASVSETLADPRLASIREERLDCFCHRIGKFLVHR
jgi:hypothetical protein